MAKKEKKQAINPKKAVKPRPAKKGKVVKGVFAEAEPKTEVTKIADKTTVAGQEPLIALKKVVVEKAISELEKFSEKSKQDSEKKSQLFEDDGEALFLQVTNLKFFADKVSLKPKSITVPHPLHNLEDFKVCLFVKDDLIDSETLEQIEAANISHLDKIISAKELKGEYKSYDARRKLVSEYDVFLSDDSLVTVLPKLLGKIFYSNARTTPIPIRLRTGKKLSITTLKNQVEKVGTQIVYVPPMGVNVVIKVGDLSSGLPKLFENVKAIAEHFQNQQIRSLSLKVQSSPSLPIYYAKKLYTEEDIKKTVDEESKPQASVSDFDKGLLELAVDEAAAAKFISKKRKNAGSIQAAKKQKA
ncbi:unnamed protein product [Kuraishia capsulata CBS 1993]|uniref:Ribosomal protein L1 n=1 Tax=Kuraishia capsulata CBS 1993 TaxID=1382522 RepID=W6MTB5_9ASCO|nr:uncharacterized protein KUCA_T00004419001 [Kuraishia capsulata CBS 1993]CDK28437.1 unnamed protein product [Kuraishia capsulata CBS 1993]